MFGLSLSEMFVICLVTLVAVGPQKLPGMLKTMGQWARKLRKMTMDVRQQTGIDEMLRAEGIQLSELRTLMRGYHGGVPAAAAAPVAQASTAPSPRSYDDPYGGFEPDPTREYPLEGADAYGALADDLLEPPPPPAPELAAAPEAVTAPEAAPAAEAAPEPAPAAEAAPTPSTVVEAAPTPAPVVEAAPAPAPVVEAARRAPPPPPVRSVPPPPPSRASAPRPSGAPPPPPPRRTLPPRPDAASGPVNKPVDAGVPPPVGEAPGSGTANGNG